MANCQPRHTHQQHGSVTWEQAVQDQRTANMATQVFRAVSVQTPQHNKDMIAVKVDGREDV